MFGAFFLLHTYLAVSGSWRINLLTLECVLDIAFVALGIKLLTSGTLVETASTTTANLQVSIERAAAIAIVVMIAVTIWDLVKYSRLAWRLRRGLSG